jgi:hypothetical protein
LVEALESILLVPVAVSRVGFEEATVDEAQVRLQLPGHYRLRLDENNDEEGGKAKEHDKAGRRNALVKVSRRLGDFRERNEDA